MSEFDRPEGNPFAATGSGSGATGTPGKTTQVGGAPARTTKDLVSHQQPASIFRTPPDEKPVNWNSYVKPVGPADPFIVSNLLPAYECPIPPNSVFESTGTHQRGTPTGSDPAIQITASKWAWRQNCWEEYRKVAAAVQAQQETVAPDVRRYQHAEKDPQLRALGLVMPKGFRGDLNTLASAQEVPHRGGTRVASLFQADNSLDVTPTDTKAMSNVAKGGADAGFLATISADSSLQAALGELNAAAHFVAATNHKLRSAQLAIEIVDAQAEANAATAEIAELKQGVAHLVSAVEFIDSGPAKLVELAKKGLEKLSHVGTVCALILQTFPIAGLAAAEAKLSAARRKMTSAKAELLERDLSAAKENSLAALQRLSAAKEKLATAMTARRQAYDLAGEQVAVVSGNVKVGAFVSALPVVEVVVASLGNITAKTKDARPAYTDLAGVGYGMAMAHRTESAFDLPVAIGTLEYCHMYLGMLHTDWAERLTALRAANEQMAGTRPSEET